MAEKERRSAPLGLRVRPSLKEMLEQLAEADRRTLASYIEGVLEQHVAEHGGVDPPQKKRGKRGK